MIKKKIRDLLHMPESLDDSTDSADSLGDVAKELETMMSDYFRRTVHKQDIQKNIEVRTRMCLGGILLVIFWSDLPSNAKIALANRAKVENFC